MPHYLSTFSSQFSPSPAARHYHPTLSIWLSVDPMSDKYTSMSPYTYCANNPVKLVDPDGRIIGEVDEASKNKIKALTDKSNEDYSRAFTRLYNRLARSKTVYNFYEATSDQVKDEIKGKIFRENDGSISIIFSSVQSSRTSYDGGFSIKYASLFEETYHAADYDRGRLDYDHPTCMDEARAWKFATKAPGTNLGYVRIIPLTASFAQTVREWSCKQLANFFHDGGEPYIDTDDNGRKIFHPVITKEDENKKMIGLYHHLPLNKKSLKNKDK